jgi:hypothetical protein
MNTTFTVETTDSGRMTRLAAILRILGAGAVIIAMYSFMASGWQSGSDVARYLIMLGHTGLLAAVGLASGHWLQEGKGARLLVSLAVISVPANFAILGAFIYSQAGAIDIAQYPRYVAWAVDSLPVALWTTAVALLVLIPVTLLGFTVLARSMSRKLSVLFLASNLALLIPSRDPEMVSLLVSLLTLGVVWGSRRTTRNQAEARTRDGILAIGLQLLPIGVLLVRTLWLYRFDLFLATMMTMTLFFVLRQVSLYLQEGSKLRDLLDLCSLAPALAVLQLLGNALLAAGLFPVSIVFPVAGLVSAGMLYDISKRNGRWSGMYRHLAVLIVLVSFIANLVLRGGPLASLVCLGMGLALICLGYRQQRLSVLAGGVALMLSGSIYQLVDLLQHFDLVNWASMAILGISCIVFASVLESKGGRLRLQISAWRERFHTWEK